MLPALFCIWRILRDILQENSIIMDIVSAFMLRQCCPAAGVINCYQF